MLKVGKTLKYTNKHNIPQVVADMLMLDDYDKEDSDISTTELKDPVRISVLKRLYAEHLEQDVSSRLASKIGTLLHAEVEKSNEDNEDVITETRMFKNIEGIILSGKFDLYFKSTGILADFKTGKTPPNAEKALKEEWEAQLNTYAYLFENHDRTSGESIEGYKVNGLKVFTLYTDWSDKKAVKPSLELDVKLWSREEQEDYIFSNINKFLDISGTVNDFIDKNPDDGFDFQSLIPRCSVEDNWYGRRCKSWCDVAKFCSQYQRSK